MENKVPFSVQIYKGPTSRRDFSDLNLSYQQSIDIFQNPLMYSVEKCPSNIVVNLGTFY